MAMVPFRCPHCNADFVAKPDSPSGSWQCAAGHRFRSSRELIGLLLARGWQPDIEVRYHAAPGQNADR
jgi:hypothetical protein